MFNAAQTGWQKYFRWNSTLYQRRGFCHQNILHSSHIAWKAESEGKGAKLSLSSQQMGQWEMGKYSSVFTMH